MVHFRHVRREVLVPLAVNVERLISHKLAQRCQQQSADGLKREQHELQLIGSDRQHVTISV